MPLAKGQTGFQPPARDAERRAFFDLLRRIKVLEDEPDGGGGGGEPLLADHLIDTVDAHDAKAVSFVPTGTIAATNVQDAIVEVAAEAGAGAGGNEVFIGPSDPGGTYELWVDDDAVPVPGAVVPTQLMSAAGSGSFTATGSPGGQVPGLFITLPARPYPRSVVATCNIGLSWISGGANTYWVATFVWTGIAAGTNRGFFWARNPTGHGQGTCQVLVNAGSPATVTMMVTADVAASAAVSGTWLDVTITPAGSLL